jgi:hypothetical protein
LGIACFVVAIFAPVLNRLIAIEVNFMGSGIFAAGVTGLIRDSVNFNHFGWDFLDIGV